MIMKGIKSIVIASMMSLSVLPTMGQDLLARQAPIDRKMKAVDSIMLNKLILEEMADNNPAADLYADWSNRYAHLEELKAERRTMIFYEAPHKLKATLSDMASYFGGDRRISISRELTKLHEETWRCTLEEAMRHFEETPPKGEFVLVIEGAPEPSEPEISFEEALRHYLEQQAYANQFLQLL